MTHQGAASAGAPADVAASCRHCVDCSRPAVHDLGGGTYCSPCLVAFADWLEREAHGVEALGMALGHVRALLEPLHGVTREDVERGAALDVEQLRAQHIYGWSGLPHGPSNDVVAGNPSPLEAWPTVEEFYAARGGARSGEADYGVDHTNEDGVDDSCRWRVSVVESTGDVYAQAPCKRHQVLLLGSVAPGPCYQDAERRFAGWAERAGRDLAWFRERTPPPHRGTLSDVTMPSGVTIISPRGAIYSRRGTRHGI